MGRLDGKVAIITGAGSGIGQAAALLFAKEGAKVVGACRTAETGEKTVKMIKDTAGEAIFIKTDVSRAEDVQNMIKTTVDTYGKLDVLFNNAGIGEQATAKTADCIEEHWDKVLAIDLKGTWLVMKYAIPEMLKAGGGSIINVASQMATRANVGFPSYTAAKGGILSLSRATAIEYAGNNIRVNVLEPGYINTPMAEGVVSNPERSKKVKQGTPQHRLGEPEEVARAALFLASDESSYITGAELAVDGGLTASQPCAYVFQ
ncbi:Dihydroanticapsin 7-dehydrogenase [subsurface metagenome]